MFITKLPKMTRSKPCAASIVNGTAQHYEPEANGSVARSTAESKTCVLLLAAPAIWQRPRPA